MVHALTLLLITLFFGRWAALIPLAVLAAIVLMVAFRLSEWHVFLHELRAPRSDALVMVATFLLTLLVDLTVGIGVGMVLAAFLFMKRMAEVTNITIVRREFEEGGTPPGRRAGGDLPPADPSGRGGLRDQRPLLLRCRREVQADAGRRLPAAQGADHPDAERPGDRFDRDARAQGPGAPHPRGRHPGAAERRELPAAHRPGARRACWTRSGRRTCSATWTRRWRRRANVCSPRPPDSGRFALPDPGSRATFRPWIRTFCSRTSRPARRPRWRGRSRRWRTAGRDSSGCSRGSTAASAGLAGSG